MNKIIMAAALVAGMTISACDTQMVQEGKAVEGDELLAKYTTVRLEGDLSGLSANERKLISVLVDASEAMDEIYWVQAYGDREELLDRISDPDLKRFAEINYGPWDRLNANESFVTGIGPKPPGANLYPTDMTEDEFESAVAADPALSGLYTIVRRDEDGSLKAIPYHEFFPEATARTAAKLREASGLAENAALKKYLSLRAAALETDDYYASDMAWMDMKDNRIDVVIGPIEVYEDELFGYKAAHEAYILLKDMEWSERLSRYAQFLPELQKDLPVAAKYKTETPGRDSDLNAYDAIFYAGQANAGSKTIAINLPNDEEVQQSKGSRRLQLKNAMRAKFDEILMPITDVLIAEDQRRHVTFDAFFGNTMFHEVAHGLGIKETITGKGTVREALRNLYSPLEEGKADILGLYMVTSLHEKGELGETDLMDNYVTFLAGIFRSTRFGASSAHGRANMIRFNFFEEAGAFSRDEATGTYRVDMEKMNDAMTALSERILVLQGEGDYEVATAFVDEYQVVGEQLQSDLDRLNEAGIPVDVVFEQGRAVLGLDPVASASSPVSGG